MLVRALVQYKVLGDDDYTYVEPFEIRYSSNFILRLDYYWKQRVVRSLAERKIKIEYIKDLSVEYVRD
jgi:hypothetical protein